MRWPGDSPGSIGSVHSTRSDSPCRRSCRPRRRSSSARGWRRCARRPGSSASLNGSDQRLAASVTLPAPAGGYREAFKGFVPARGTGAPALVEPAGDDRQPEPLARPVGDLGGAHRAVHARGRSRTWPSSTPSPASSSAAATSARASSARSIRAGGWSSPTRTTRPLKPAPDLKLPGFALIADLNPDDDDFASGSRSPSSRSSASPTWARRRRRRAAAGAGLGGLRGRDDRDGALHGLEGGDGRRQGQAKTAVHQRHNFSPSIAQVENHFILSSSVGLTRDLIEALKAPATGDRRHAPGRGRRPRAGPPGQLNRNRLVMQNMLDKGHDKAAAETEIDQLGAAAPVAGPGPADGPGRPRDVAIRPGLHSLQPPLNRIDRDDEPPPC